MIATGGAPVRPDLPGIDLPLVHGVQDLTDAQALLSLADAGCRRIVIVGGGYIGLEMAEAYVERGCTATVVERGRQPLGVIDERSRRRASPTRCAATASTSAATPTSRASSPPRCSRPRARSGADLVVLGIGVRPALRARRGGGHRARRPRTRSTSTSARRPLPPHVWAAGDCAEATHLVTGAPGAHPARHVRQPPRPRRRASTWPAATPGRRRVLGTAITKLCALEVALTGVRLEPGAGGRPRRRRHDGRHDDGWPATCRTRRR